MRILHEIAFASLQQCAGVVESVDAPDSKSGEGNLVRVRVSPPAPNATSPLHFILSYVGRRLACSLTEQACPRIVSPLLRRDGVGRHPAAKRTASNSSAVGA
jgi:hypothetical protein